MDYLTTKEASAKWGIKERRITVLCNENRISGAIYVGRIWLIPKDAEKPADARIKSGKYVGIKRSSSANERTTEGSEKEC